MDQKLEIKEEPVWLEETANSSLENFEFVSELISLKQETKSGLTEPQPTQGNAFKEHFEHLSEMAPLKLETKSELTEPVPTQENAFENATDVKDEIFIEEHTIEQLDSCFIEKTRMKNYAVLTMPTGERRYQCTVCSMMFSLEYYLKKHMENHSEERLYICDVCNRTYCMKQSLQRHMSIHSKNRPYQCNKCNSTFTRADRLRTHMGIHSGRSVRSAKKRLPNETVYEST